MDAVNAFLTFEHEALRLTHYGWCLMLAYLLFRRFFDWRTARHLHPLYRQVPSLAMPFVMVVAGLFLATQFVLSTRGVLGTFELVSPLAFTLPELLIARVMRMAVAAVFIGMFSYEPRFKMYWLAGWLGFSHFIMLLAMPR